ncbi:MAG TPA: hypothetical protein VGF28_04015 [Thermoanaerobaculia bacterium]
MNRTLLVLVIGIAVTLGLMVVLVNLSIERAYQREGAAEWPGGLGPLTAAPARFPPTETNEAAAEFAELAAALEPPEAVADYVRAEVGRDGEAADPPPEVTAYLAEHEARLDAIRDDLLSGAELVWDHDPALGYDAKPPRLAMHLGVARLLVTRALVRDDWEELRAASRLARPLMKRPEFTATVVGLAILRIVVASAAKLPLPAPRWLDEVYAIDPEAVLGRSFQYETWLAWRGAEDSFLPFMAANYVRHQRETLRQLDMTRCPPGAARHFARRMTEIPRWNFYARIIAPGVETAWDRVARYRAEREATANVLRAAAGQPIVTASQCGGTWSSETLPDGRIRVSYSLAIPKSGERDVEIPLTRTTRARTTRQST